jgi:PKD repeat protein
MKYWVASSNRNNSEIADKWKGSCHDFTGGFLDFGYGTNSIEPARTNTYTTPGQYTVVQTVRDDMRTN